MTDSFRQATGRKVVSRASAQALGAVGHLLVAHQGRQIAAVILGRGKKAQLVDWAAVTGFGPDAVMVTDEDELRPPADDRERDACAGKLELLGQRMLTERGNDLGRVEDVTFDSDTGALVALRVGELEVDADAVMGIGSYAVVVDDRHEAP